MKTKVSLVRCKNYDFDLVYSAVKRAIALLGGIEKFIKPESKVLLKPNLLLPASPEMAITTHPELIRAVIRILKEIKCRIFLGDSPSAWIKIRSPRFIYEKTGMLALAEEEDIELVDFDHPMWKKKFPLTKWLDECDYFISLPKFKTHNLTILTGAVKNLYGLVCGLYKIELHKRYYNLYDFVETLLDLYELKKPDLTIIDGIVSLEGDGPTSGGTPRSTGFILAGAVCIALDSVLAVIMGLNPLDIPTNREAKKRNLGATEIENIEILGDSLSEFIFDDFKLPSTSLVKRLPPPIINFTKKFIRFYPLIEEQRCTHCLACLNTCPVKAIILKNNRMSINYNKCISCFCCQEVCLYSAIKVKKSILAKIMRL